MLWELFKKYWDIFGGIITGITLSLLAKFELNTIQLYYSIIILCLVSIGVFKIIRQTIDKSRRSKTLIDNVVDSQKPVKAIRVAQNPTKDGEELGKILIKLWREFKKMTQKAKVFFKKFKGGLLTVALATLFVIEMFGGNINKVFGNILIITTEKGEFNILEVVLLVATITVALLSDPRKKVEITSTSEAPVEKVTNPIVIADIKKNIQDFLATVKELKKNKATKETELATLQASLEKAKQTHEAKKEMYAMTPKLATDKDVQDAANEVVNIEARINENKNIIVNIETNINSYNNNIKNLKSKL